MITKHMLDQVSEILFHESCPDGTAAAMICRAAIYRDDVQFTSLQYGTDRMAKLEPRPNQLFVDITPPIDRWEEWKAVSPIVLDHHATAKHVTEGLGGVYGENETHSGAMLAYDYVLSTLAGSGTLDSNTMGSQGLAEWRDFAELAMIRDTWKKEHPRWREACAQAMAVQFHGSKKLVGMVGAGDFPFASLMEMGMALLEQGERKVRKIAEGAYHKEIVGASGGSFKLGFFNCTEKLTSDVGNYLVERGSDAAIGYFHAFEDGELRLCVSVRSADRLSSKAIAQAFGGGGHERAAGFRMKVNDTPTPDALAEKISAVV